MDVAKWDYRNKSTQFVSHKNIRDYQLIESLFNSIHGQKSIIWRFQRYSVQNKCTNFLIFRKSKYHFWTNKKQNWLKIFFKNSFDLLMFCPTNWTPKSLLYLETHEEDKFSRNNSSIFISWVQIIWGLGGVVDCVDTSCNGAMSNQWMA